MTVMVPVFERVAPIFGVRDVSAALAYYETLGFRVRTYKGGNYGFAKEDRVDRHREADAVQHVAGLELSRIGAERNARRRRRVDAHAITDAGSAANSPAGSSSSGASRRGAASP